MMEKKCFQLLSRVENAHAPALTKAFPNVLAEYQDFTRVGFVQHPEEDKIAQNFQRRIISYRPRLVQKKVYVSRQTMFLPSITTNSKEWMASVGTMLTRFIPRDACFEKDPLGTPSHEKKQVELDHVIPISWIWQHPTFFKKDVRRVQAICGWYNILPLPYCTNRQKANFTPLQLDVDRNIQNKRVYLETYFEERYDEQWLDDMEQLYQEIYDEILSVIRKKKGGPSPPSKPPSVEKLCVQP